MTMAYDVSNKTPLRFGAPPAAAEPLLYDKAKLAQALSVSVRTLERWIASEEFPEADITRGAKLRFWKRETVVKWIAEQAGERR